MTRSGGSFKAATSFRSLMPARRGSVRNRGMPDVVWDGMTPFLDGFAAELVKTGARAARSVITPQSSNVRGFRYDPASQELFITYKSGGTYRYSGVPAKTVRSLGRAKSVGQAVNKHVKGPGYAYEKVANGDMLQYYADNPDKLRAKRERDRRKTGRVKTAQISWRAWGRELLQDAVNRLIGLRQDTTRRSEKRHRKHAGVPIEAGSIVDTMRSIRKIAGVAKKQVTWQGLRMKIEHEPGDMRSGKSKDGKSWERKMFDSYGYIPGTKGMAADGDAIDIYFSHAPVDGPVFMVRQVKKDTGAYDEDKYMVGFGSFGAAKEAYLRHMPAWAYGTMSQIGKTFDDFKSYLKSNPES